MVFIYQLVDFILRAVELLVLIRIVLSWIMPYTRNELTDTIHFLTEPILAPLRIIIPIGNMRLDIAPIAVYFITNLIRKILFLILF
ncbi:YggT family protein [Hypnocyclicus thermotrophus]|uniref:YggT family protein n=1 Tax=Hypnocyclicus thermotrophus TaxID=1627895 RepID=A0AA46DZP5_9FUSO|nr:YggT family protein [Hypnocyclicus thermotrophus]TDT71899.1 YggT family protein [Hypnocyclicus thermotrophus]